VALGNVHNVDGHDEYADVGLFLNKLNEMCFCGSLA